MIRNKFGGNLLEYLPNYQTRSIKRAAMAGAETCIKTGLLNGF
jgi:hypothetical protein